MADSNITVNVGIQVEGIDTLARAKHVINVLQERKRQVEECGYTPEVDDDRGGWMHLANEAGLRLSSVQQFGVDTYADARRILTESAALALAGLEALDREEEAGVGE